jgi:hypothetical protein
MFLRILRSCGRVKAQRREPRVALGHTHWGRRCANPTPSSLSSIELPSVHRQGTHFFSSSIQHTPNLPDPVPCPALPCPALPCPALPCPALPCPALLAGPSYEFANGRLRAHPIDAPGVSRAHGMLAATTGPQACPVVALAAPCALVDKTPAVQT